MNTIFTTDGETITGETVQPQSTLDCIDSRETHLVASLTITDPSRQKLLLQRKDVGGIEMLMPAVSGHLNYVREAVGMLINNGILGGYMRDELFRESIEELGVVSDYLGIMPARMYREFYLRDKDVDPHAFNHLTKTYYQEVKPQLLDEKILSKIFRPTQEVGGTDRIDSLVVVTRLELEFLVEETERLINFRGNQTFLYPPMKEYFRQFLSFTS